VWYEETDKEGTMDASEFPLVREVDADVGGIRLTAIFTTDEAYRYARCEYTLTGKRNSKHRVVNYRYGDERMLRRYIDEDRKALLKQEHPFIG
jgi:hypothetical protein